MNSARLAHLVGHLHHHPVQLPGDRDLACHARAPIFVPAHPVQHVQLLLGWRWQLLVQFHNLHAASCAGQLLIAQSVNIDILVHRPVGDVHQVVAYAVVCGYLTCRPVAPNGLSECGRGYSGEGPRRASVNQSAFSTFIYIIGVFRDHFFLGAVTKFLKLIPHIQSKLLSLLSKVSLIFSPLTSTPPFQSKLRHSGQLLLISRKITPICYLLHSCIKYSKFLRYTTWAGSSGYCFYSCQFLAYSCFSRQVLGYWLLVGPFTGLTSFLAAFFFPPPASIFTKGRQFRIIFLVCFSNLSASLWIYQVRAYVYMLFGIVGFGIFPDQIDILEAILNILVGFSGDLFLDGAEVHGVGYDCGVVQQSISFPIDRLSKCQ